MRFGYMCCLLPGVIAAPAASAAASSSPAFGMGESQQTLILAPYLWAPNISGSIGLAGLRVPLQLSSNLLFKGVNTGGMGYARWQRGDRFAYAEGIFISFGEKVLRLSSVNLSIRRCDLAKSVAVWSGAEV